MVLLALGCAAVLIATAALAVVAVDAARARRIVYGVCLIASLALFSIALLALLGISHGPSAASLPLGLPWLGAHFRLDALSAFFLAVVNLGAAAASLFALGYGRHEDAPRRVLPFYLAFLAGMSIVVLADGGYAFGDIRDGHPSPTLAASILILALIGAGSKAGLVPLHVWLPLAHPAAPSHVSALMSGVMTKVAVYGFVRIVFDLIGTPAWWWSMVVLALGGITAVMGVLYALMQHDLKRLLAYHTVENIGIIFIGLGLALAFKAHGMATAAALALTAGLLHVFNHSVFKSLLFFGAGAVLNATGERDMEHLGGLIHRMPQTAFLFLVGCAAISALPPLNGFVSEWLTFQAILLSPQLPSWGLKLIVPAVGALLALSAALAAACFVKAFGVTFLGRARTPAAARAAEADRYSLAAMGFLAALCLVAGIIPGIFMDALAPAVASLVGQRLPMQSGVEWLSIVPIAESRSSYNGLLVFLFIIISATLAALAIHRFASDRLRRAPPWDCGYPDPSPATQYTADSFAQPIRRVFGTVVFRAREHGEMPPPGETGPARLTVSLRDLVWDTLYAPLAAGIGIVADRLNHLQFLTIRQFLSLVFAALVILLLVLAIWP